MSTKKKAALKRSPFTKPILPAGTKEPVYDLAYLTKIGEEIVKLLEKLIERLDAATIKAIADEFDRSLGDVVRGGPRYTSGGFKRRSGDIYENVAQPGSPNAGDVDPLDKEADEEFFKKARLRMPNDDNPSGSV